MKYAASWLGLLTSLLWFIGPSNASRPHIVFILLDDVGWNDVSFHGSPQIPTPNMDRLAADGVLLDNYYVNPVCSPTRASLMSGRSIMHHGIYVPYDEGELAEGLNLTYTLLPERLSTQFGYRTYMVGKWHLGMKESNYLPSSRGFERYFGYYNGVTDYWKYYTDGGASGHLGLALHVGGSDLGFAPGDDQPIYNASGQYSTHLFSNKAAEWIQYHGAARPDEPMFMYLALQAAHSANNKFVQAPQDDIDKFQDISPDKTCGQYDLPNDDTCDKAAMRKTVAATVSAADQAVGRVVEALREAGMLDNTLLIVSSDNGGPVDGANNNMMNNFPLRGCKGGYYEGGMRAAGFVYGPNGLVPRGVVSRALHHVTDWYFTLLSAAAGRGNSTRGSEPTRYEDIELGPNEPPLELGDGVDNWAAISQGRPSARTEIAHVTQATGSVLASHALRLGDLKLVVSPVVDVLCNKAGWYPPPGLAWNYSTFTVRCGPPPNATEAELLAQCSSEQPCLFNISADPCEYHDLSASRPDLVQSLTQRLAEYQKTTVLPWANFRKQDPNSDPMLHGPRVRITPDIPEGPHYYEGLWHPWLNSTQDKMYYPTNYSGPPYSNPPL